MFSSWMFAYRTLMAEEYLLDDFQPQPAVLRGYRRSFVHSSTLLWGTPESPCPLLGLVRGGECWGVAFRVPWSRRRELLAHLAPQEDAENQKRIRATVELNSGDRRTAQVWVCRDASAVTGLEGDLEALRDALLAAHGTAGVGVEYVRTVAQALDHWGIEDPVVAAIWERLAAWRPR